MSGFHWSPVLRWPAGILPKSIRSGQHCFSFLDCDLLSIQMLLIAIQYKIMISFLFVGQVFILELLHTHTHKGGGGGGGLANNIMGLFHCASCSKIHFLLSATTKQHQLLILQIRKQRTKQTFKIKEGGSVSERDNQ